MKEIEHELDVKFVDGMPFYELDAPPESDLMKVFTWGTLLSILLWLVVVGTIYWVNK